jgi:uncharacterized SAM-binding protein YcdF (DUF218 family)
MYRLYALVKSNRRGCLRILILLGVAAFGIVFAFANAAIWLQAPAQVPLQTDAIVILGGDDGDRAMKALQLYRAGYAPVLVLTGLERGNAAPPPSLTWRASFLELRGVPNSAIRFELVARNSYMEAVELLALMRKEGWRTLIVVSDPPHMRRLAWTWSRVFEGSGLSYVLVASEPDWWDAGNWWRDEKSGQFVITEYIKLAYYIAKR